MGFFMAAFLSFMAFFSTGLRVLIGLVEGELGARDLLSWLGLMAAVVPVYVLGCWLAGAAWDATRPIRHRLIGYLLRGGATAAAMYGAVGLLMPLIDDDPLTPPLFLLMLAGLTAVGVLIGAVKWTRDWWRDALPEPPPRGPSAVV